MNAPDLRRAPPVSAPPVVEELDPARARRILDVLLANMQRVVQGHEAVLRRLLCALAAGGHVLLEDVPGTGKTTMAKVLARSLALEFQRIQFTPDLMPADILGVSVFEPASAQRPAGFHFRPGPVFTDILLADEINRASPRAQSALLEAMGESQISLDGERRSLSPTFFVIATQNPVEFEGTYPLPESQMDRFAVRLALGYVSPADEVKILADRAELDPLEAVEAVASPGDVLSLRAAVRAVTSSEEVKRYIVDLVGATRARPKVRVGASARASLTLHRVAQALALLEGQNFVSPDHVQQVAREVLAHRLLIEPEARYAGATGEQVIEEVLGEVPVPV